MKRQRGRNRKPGGGGGGGHYNHNQPNRTLESNGPDIKVRGPAAHIYERYLQLARDASSSGDRVMGENYLQHAEHYFRMLRAMQPAMPPPQDRFAHDADEDGEDDAAAESSANESADADAAVEANEDEQTQSHAGQPSDRDNGGEGNFRRRRGRRTRFRPEGGQEGGEPSADHGDGEGGEPRQQAERSERPERRERAPRQGGEREAGQEGFSNGPKPAFLRGD